VWRSSDGWPLAGAHDVGSSSSFSGDNTGGNADDAATAAANSIVGFGIIPTRQSAMKGRQNRNNAPVWTLVALITNRGGSAGRSCSVASPNRCFRYASVTLSKIVPGSRIPPRIDPSSIVLLARARMKQHCPIAAARETERDSILCCARIVVRRSGVNDCDWSGAFDLVVVWRHVGLRYRLSRCHSIGGSIS
jgi:hypothetical protein